MTNTSAIADRFNARLAELNAEVSSIETELRTPLDADFSEQANEIEDQDALKGIEANHRDEINQIHAALNRIAAGTYGQCSVCGIDIPAARLEALPTATTCIAHAGP